MIPKPPFLKDLDPGQEIAEFDTVLLAIARVLGRAEAP